MNVQAITNGNVDSVDTVVVAQEVFAVPTHGGARGKRGKKKQLVFEAAFSGTQEDYREVIYPLLCSLGAIPCINE